MNYGHNMDPDIEKLIHLLKKILKKDPQGSEQLSKIFDNKALNINLCFLTFVPMSFDEVDELNELYEDVMSRGEDAFRRDLESELEFKLNHNDVEFLKKNGMYFD